MTNGHGTEGSAKEAIDQMLVHTRMPIAPDERQWLEDMYPLIRQMTERLRAPETRYSEPAIVYPAAAPPPPQERWDVARLKRLDAVLFGNDYSDETFAKMLPYVVAYQQSLSTLRQLPLGTVPSALVMLAGGKQ